jgi:hypothetical protein
MCHVPYISVLARIFIFTCPLPRPPTPSLIKMYIRNRILFRVCDGEGGSIRLRTETISSKQSMVAEIDYGAMKSAFIRRQYPVTSVMNYYNCFMTTLSIRPWKMQEQHLPANSYLHAHLDTHFGEIQSIFKTNPFEQCYYIFCNVIDQSG